MLYEVLIEAYMNGIAVNGDWYRYHAQAVAAAASLGHISTETPEGNFGRHYRPTRRGMELMEVWRSM